MPKNRRDLEVMYKNASRWEHLVKNHCKTVLVHVFEARGIPDFPAQQRRRLEMFVDKEMENELGRKGEAGND